MVFFFCFNTLTLGADWNELQKDPTREGYLPDRIQTPLIEVCKVEVGDEISGTIAVVNNEVLFATQKGIIGSASLINGELFWQRNLKAKISSSMTASESEVFIATESGDVYAMNRTNGAILWKVSLGIPFKAPLTKFFRYLYLLGANGQIYCLNAFDGKPLWNTELKGEFLTAASMKQNNLYIVSKEGRLFCLDAYNGKTRWVYEMKQTSRSTPMPSTEIILVGDDDGNLYGIDYLKGTEYFIKSFEDAITSPFAYGYFDRRMMIVGNEKSYTAFGSSNGNIMWKYVVDEASIPPIGTGDRIWIPGKNNKLVMLDSFSGVNDYEILLPSKITSAMAVSNGRLVLGTEKGTIHVFAPSEIDFILEMKPDIGVIVPGKQFSFQVSILTSAEFNDLISLNVSGFPCSCKGVGRYFDKSSLSNSGTVNLVIDTTEEATPERFRITISAYSRSGIKREASSILVIQPTYEVNIIEFGDLDQIKSGTDFQLDLMIKDAINIRSVQSIIKYSPEVLFLHDVSAGSFYGERIQDYVFDWDKNDDQGNVVIGLTKRDIGSSGTGTIASLHFRAKKPGNAGIKIVRSSVRDSFLLETSYQTKELNLEIDKGAQKIIQLRIGSPTILIDHLEYPIDAPPVIEKGRTLVPIRRIAEELESKVSWDAKEQKVTLERYDKIIELWIGRVNCRVNGVEKPLPSNVSPKIIQQRTFLPLRFVAEELDANVQWYAETQTIRILYPDF